MSRKPTRVVTHLRITGFQSPAAEYAEARLSLDDRYGTEDPAINIIYLDCDYPLFGLKKGDEIAVLMGGRPAHNDLVYTNLHGESGVFRFERRDGVGHLHPSKYQRDELDDVICGVILSQHRHLVDKDRRSAIIHY